MKSFPVILFISLFLLPATGIYSQGFKAGAILGINASQIDGDDLAGYNKLGISSGIKIQYSSAQRLQYHLELLYSQRGSQSDLRFGSPSESTGIKLNYLEIPLVISLNDWFQQEGEYYKVRLEAGLSFGYLFDVSSNNTFYDDAEEQFSTKDFSYLLGAAYHVNPKLAFGLRYTRSFNKMFTSEDQDIVGLLGYFITLRSEYHF